MLALFPFCFCRLTSGWSLGPLRFRSCKSAHCLLPSQGHRERGSEPGQQSARPTPAREQAAMATHTHSLPLKGTRRLSSTSFWKSGDLEGFLLPHEGAEAGSGFSLLTLTLPLPVPRPPPITPTLQWGEGLL